MEGMGWAGLGWAGLAGSEEAADWVVAAACHMSIQSSSPPQQSCSPPV